MSSLNRWDPVRDMTTLRDAVDQLMEQAVLRPGFGLMGLAGANFVGASLGQMNVFESGNRYICQVLLPGAGAQDIDLTVRQNTLSIKVTMPELISEEQRKTATYLLREFGAGEFSRTVSFPKDVNGDAVQAQFEQGVLTIAIPLAQHAQPRRIQITEPSAQQQQQLNATPAPTVVDEKASSQTSAHV